MLHLASMSKSEDKMNGKLWNLLDTNAALFVGKKKKKKPLQMQWQANQQSWIIQRTTLPALQFQQEFKREYLVLGLKILQ